VGGKKTKKLKEYDRNFSSPEKRGSSKLKKTEKIRKRRRGQKDIPTEKEKIRRIFKISGKTEGRRAGR